MRLFALILSAVLCLGTIGCLDRTPKPDPGYTNQVLTATGLLIRNRPGSIEYWRGHEFTVKHMPILPSEDITEAGIRGLVGKHVKAEGHWDPGFEWEPEE